MLRWGVSWLRWWGVSYFQGFFFCCWMLGLIGLIWDVWKDSSLAGAVRIYFGFSSFTLVLNLGFSWVIGFGNWWANRWPEWPFLSGACFNWRVEFVRYFLGSGTGVFYGFFLFNLSLCFCLTDFSWIVSLTLFTNPSARAGYDTRSNFKRSLIGLNSEFSFSQTSCLTKAEEPSLSYNLPIAGGGIIGFIPFPRVLVVCEMQSASSRIWTRVAASISNDDNHYTSGTSKNCFFNCSWNFGQSIGSSCSSFSIWARYLLNWSMLFLLLLLVVVVVMVVLLLLPLLLIRLTFFAILV